MLLLAALYLNYRIFLVSEMPDKNHNFIIASYSIVAVGTGFSPSSLDADLLAEKEIVPPEWNWKVSDSTNVQLLSQVAYQDGNVVVRVERNKFLVTDSQITENKIEKSKISEIAKRFIQRHKHLSFTALGINFESVLEFDAATGFLKNNFLKSDKKITGGHNVHSVAFTMQYELQNGGLLSVVINEGTLSKQNSSEPIEYKGILCSANFHREIPKDADTALIIAQLNHVRNDKQMLKEIASSLAK